MEKPTNKEESPLRTFCCDEKVPFSKRLKKAIGSESNRSFADKSGVSEAMIRKYISGGALPNLETLDRISKATGKSISWLTQGYGANFNDDTSSTKELEAFYNQNNITIQFNSQTHILVPELNIKVAAGNGVYPIEDDEKQIGQFIFSKYWLAKEGLSNAKLATFHVVGDSMETTINDGDIILVNVKEEGWTGALNGVFVILVNDLLMVKRIQYDMINNGFHIKSDNSIYDPYFIKPDAGMLFKIVAKVERILTKMRPTKQL